MRMIRPFIVLHNAEEYNKGKPIIVYIDKISTIQPRIVGEGIEDGTVLYVENWCYNVQESLGDVLRKVNGAEHDGQREM